MLPLGGGGLHKPWGDSTSGGFPCCWGTSTEQFAGRHLELIFTEAPDHATLFVNVFLSATLTWPARGGLTVTQVAGWPASTTSSTRLTIGGGGGGGGGGADFTLALRVPGWTTAEGARVTVNGVPFPGAAPGTYLRVARTWAAGDVLDAYFPATLRVEQVTDDRPQYAQWGAVLYGGILLAGVNTSTDRAPNHDPAAVATWVTRVPDESRLRFSMAGPFGVCAGGDDTPIAMMPLMEVKDESYTVYWRTGVEAPAVTYNGSATSPVDSSPSQWQAHGGASINGGVIRTGNPQEVNAITLLPVIEDATHRVAGLSFTEAYNVGYGPAGAQVGSSYAVVLVDACSADPAHPYVLATFYTSPDLTAPAYDACSTCYSPPVRRNATLATPVAVTKPSQLAIIVTDNDRNLQLVIPMAFEVTWE